MTDDRRLGLSWAFASAVTAGVFVIPWKLANASGDSSHSVLLMLGSAALMNSTLVVSQALRSDGPKLRIRSIDLGIGALLASFTLVGNLASATAIQQLSPALLNVLLRAEVLFVAILAWLLLGERVEGRFWLGVVIAVLGLVVLQGPLTEAPALGLFGKGTGMALLAALSFSALTILTRRFIHQIDPVVVNAARLWFAVALWFGFHAFPRFANLPREQVVYSALAALAGPFVGRICLMISSRYIEARVTTLASLTTPVLTLVLALLILSDWPTTHELVGGAIMIAGISIPLLRIGQKPTLRESET